MQAWRGVDIKASIEAVSAWPVYVCNDATGACAAELVFGNGGQYLDFLYIFIGWFIGGGVVLNGSLFPGRTGYAGAVGQLPVPVPRRRPAAVPAAHPQRLDLHPRARGDSAQVATRARCGNRPTTGRASRQRSRTGSRRSPATLRSPSSPRVSIIDFEAVVVDGAFPAAVRSRVVARIRERLRDFDRQGLSPFAVAEGSIGSGARAIGGACLPLLANFARDRDVLFKEAA